MIIEGDYDIDDWYGEVRVDGKPLDPLISQRVRNHSPDGFSWGYAGSGPSQLALAILLAYGLKPTIAMQLYQQFKRDFIQNLPTRDKFKIDIDIARWLQLEGQKNG